jgi:DNA-binding response OmpR family regulator
LAIGGQVIRRKIMQTILIVEDEPTLQKALRIALEREGYEVKSALEGDAGLKLAKESKPNLILLDLILPKIDGFEILAELKKDESTKEIPVIILTNLESSQDIEKALVLGAKTYLVKANYDLKDIIKKVKENIQ